MGIAHYRVLHYAPNAVLNVTCHAENSQLYHKKKKLSKLRINTFGNSVLFWTGRHRNFHKNSIKDELKAYVSP
jgi:hypothetical protein